MSALDCPAFVERFASYYDRALPVLTGDEYRPETGARLQEICVGARDAAETKAGVRRVCARVLKAA